MFAFGFVFAYLGDYLKYYEMSQLFSELALAEELRISYSLLLLYYFVFESLTLRSLRKYVINSKVLMHNSNEATPEDIFVRTLSRLIPFDSFSFFGIKGKGCHDSISKTYVVEIAKFEAEHLLTNELDQIGQSPE